MLAKVRCLPSDHWPVIAESLEIRVTVLLGNSHLQDHFNGQQCT